MKRALVLAILTAIACGQTTVEPAPGEILLYVDTDAIVPSVRPPSALEPAPLFDHLRIEVFAPGETTPCDDCTNEFSVDEALFKSGGASVGIAPPVGRGGFVARVRLFYRALRGEGVDPDPDVTIEHVVALPAPGEHGQTKVSVVMLTEELGTPVGTLDEPVDPDPGPPSGSLVGTWSKGARVDCAHPRRDGMVCVPGGAYWMGDRRKLFAVLPDFDVNRARIVVLSPFFLDAHEVTVAEFRADGKGKADAPRDNGDGSLGNDFCTFTSAATPRDAFPINCVRWTEANAYCQRRGVELPSEAQFEYAASGLQNHSFVWGEDLPECADAVYSRMGWGAFADSLTTCKPPKPYGGTEVMGSGVRDRLVLPTGTILDLIGNVHEWERDIWNDPKEPCWSKPGVFVDPVCVKPGAKGARARSIRGGAWALAIGQLDRRARSYASDTTTLLSGGFRCAAVDK